MNSVRNPFVILLGETQWVMFCTEAWGCAPDMHVAVKVFKLVRFRCVFWEHFDCLRIFSLIDG